MYKDDIKEIKIEKRKAKWWFIKEYTIMYVKAFINQEYDMAEKIKMCLRKYLIIENNEKELLNVMNSLYGYFDNLEIMENMFTTIDTLFFNLYDYYDNALNGFEDAINLKQSYRSNLTQEPEFLDEDKKRELIKELYDKIVS